MPGTRQPPFGVECCCMPSLPRLQAHLPGANLRLTTIGASVPALMPDVRSAGVYFEALPPTTDLVGEGQRLG
jgi:hypothetical protein